MRRIVMWFLATAAAVALLFSYRTSTSGPTGGSGAVAAAPKIVSGDPGSTSAPGGPPADVVANGAVARTRWGPVQVQVQITSRRIVDVRVLQQPNGNRTDAEIHSYALPQLRQQVLQAQSSNVDGVSGATVTSDGYRQSLASALDTAHFNA